MSRLRAENISMSLDGIGRDGGLLCFSEGDFASLCQKRLSA